VDHDHANELLGAFVLDSCGEDETERLRVHLQACLECRDEIDRLDAVAGLIGASDLEEPPAYLREVVLEAARVGPPPRAGGQ
jgi:predicted anti-sigma-YlaC factor YlaD